MKYLIKNIENEILKLKSTFALWLSIISSLFIPLIFFMYYTLKHKTLIPEEGINPWDKFLLDQIMSVSTLLVPLFIVLATSLIVQIEHKSSSLKYLFTQPVPKWSIYFGKLIVTIGLIVLTYIMFLLSMVVLGYAVGFVHQELKFLDFTPNLETPIKLLFRSLIAVLAMVSLQFWLSFRVRNFVIPLGIGMVMIITGLIVYKAEEAVFFPYAFNRLSLFPLNNENVEAMFWFPRVSIISLIYFIIFSTIGFIDISKMNIK